MRKSLALPLLTLLLALFTSCATQSRADQAEALNSALTPPAEALAKASDLYAGREDIDKVRKALQVLDSARNPDDRNFKVEAAFAKYSYFLGSRKQVDDDEAEKVLKKGIVAARIAERLEPDKPDGHFWEAAILGEQSKRAPMTVGLVSVKKIRRGMEKVIEIDPGFQASSAYLGLGQLELNTRGMAGGDVDKAIEYLKKGLSQSKNNAYFYVYLAQAYFIVDRNDDAKKLIAELKSMDPDPEYKPEYKDALKIADKLLKENT